MSANDMLIVSRRIRVPVSVVVREVEHSLKDPEVTYAAFKQRVSPRKVALDRATSKLLLRR